LTVVLPPSDPTLGCELSCGCVITGDQMIPLLGSKPGDERACPIHGPLLLPAGTTIRVVATNVPVSMPGLVVEDEDEDGSGADLGDLVDASGRVDELLRRHTERAVFPDRGLPGGPPPHFHDESHDRAPEMEIVQVVKVTFLRGQGCCERSLVRRVTAYYGMDGRLIVEDDPSPQSIPCGFHEFAHPFDGVSNGAGCFEASS